MERTKRRGMDALMSRVEPAKTKRRSDARRKTSCPQNRGGKHKAD